jgi:hypothetical protein
MIPEPRNATTLDILGFTVHVYEQPHLGWVVEAGRIRATGFHNIGEAASYARRCLASA